MRDLFRKYLIILLLPALIYSCSGNHLITDKEYLNNVEKKFRERMDLAERRKKELFSVFDKNLSPQQTEALEFLFAYMPLNDLADYSGEFFLANADRALQAVNSVPWGKDIPENIFLHYVLPCRVNNENLDSFRIFCYDEIHKRIAGKNMMDAALEINYWCHEKVSYQPADIRTSAPLSTMLSARGRCGEESTLTVAAFRTAGIPARQVYTPRWAHVDDNHAWVEVWIDGNWHYLGACEPEPVLDRGWFTEPARRAMLVHTKSFGAAYGNENVINKNQNFTEVNNLSTYANTKKIYVKVVNTEGLPVNGAVVEYCLYNYAEFYPLTSVPVNEKGISSFETGMGDLLIWARHDDEYAWEKISVAGTDSVYLTLKPVEKRDFSVDLDLSVPPVLPPLQGPPEDLVERNSAKMNQGNLIRLNYISSWIKHSEILNFAANTGIDSTKAVSIFSRAMGNYNEIRNFILSAPDSLKNDALSMLEVLPDKDLRDTKASVLTDHLITSFLNRNRSYDNDLFIKYILNPRVSNELLTAWRSYFSQNLPTSIREAAAENPSAILKFINDSIRIADDENYYGTPITPAGVFRLRVSDQASRAILFVVICRTMGIPSRLEPGRSVPQYYSDGKWTDVFFSDQKSQGSDFGFLKLTSSDTRPVPEYSNHFTIARFENGRYNTLDYDFAKKVTDFNELMLPSGNYMITTGNRLPDNKILSRITFFELKGDEHKVMEVNLRKDNSALSSSGKLEFSVVGGLFPGKSLDISRGVILLWIEPGKEPTRHVFSDLPLVKNELDKWGGNLIFLDATSSSEPFIPDLKDLPERCLFAKDPGMKAFLSSIKMNKAISQSLPVVLYVNPEGNILFISSGYRIGIGDQLLKIIDKTSNHN